MASEHITRCPHCRTVFKVRPEQLAQAQGWLRCAQCRQVFDSKGLVLPWQGAFPPEASAVAGKLDLNDFLQSEDQGDARVAPAPMPAPADQQDPLLDFEQALATFPVPALPLHEPQPEPAVKARGPGTRALLLTGALVLALLAQLAWVSRSAWRESVGLSVTVQALCQRAHCSVPVLSDAGRLVIETSRLVQAGAEHRLEWTLHNTSVWPMHTPALELVLTGDNEVVQVRRVVLPDEAGAPPTLAPGQSWDGQLMLDMAGERPLSGYRLRVFYP